MFTHYRFQQLLMSYMSIIDPQLVNIEIYTLPSDAHSVTPEARLRQRKSELRLNYQGQSYDLVRVFASHKLERAKQQLQQLVLSQSHYSNAIDGDAVSSRAIERYLMVREVGYYSLWEIDSTLDRSNPNQQSEREILELQQASIWLFQELWLQWQDLVGAKQLRVFAKNLLTVTPQLQSWVDLDRLLLLDPLTIVKLEDWSKLDSIAFVRQLDRLTQQKIGQQLGKKLTIDIIQGMPESLRSRLTDILDI